MAKGDVLETGILEHILNNADIANIGDAAGLLGSAADGSLYLSLHTSSAGDAGDQTTNEIAYTSYARVAVARTGAVWTVTGPSAVLASPPAEFPAGSGGSGTATHFGLGTASSGAGVLLYHGAITPSIVCGDGVTPRISPTITES
jgi:hypothetical protein